MFHIKCGFRITRSEILQAVGTETGSQIISPLFNNVYSFYSYIKQYYANHGIALYGSHQLEKHGL